MRPTDDLRTWAAAYREAGQPSEALRQRILAAVEAFDEEPIADAREQGARRSWAVGLGVGALLGVAALLLLSWVARFVRPEVEHASTVPSTAPYARASDDEVAEAQSRERATQVVEAQPVASETERIEPAPVVSSTPRKTAVAPPVRAPEQPAEPRVLAPSEDLESLRRLRAAEQLLASDPARARALLEAHARTYPTTTVDLEREALWIRAACRSGGAESLERRRSAFAQRSGVAAYLAAIARDCDRR